MPFSLLGGAAAGSATGGCFGGMGFCSLLQWRNSKLNPPRLSEDRINEAVAVPQASPFGRFSSKPWTPMALMSPTTHLRRGPSPKHTTSSKDVGVSSDAFLTKKPTDFRYIQGVARELDGTVFKTLLGKLIGETRHLQNNPRLNVVPEETRAAKIVMEELAPYTREAGGPLIVEMLEYKTRRANLKIVYPGTSDKTVAFIGSHLDVVPANPEQWDVDPFKLTEDGDLLYGRGTTDCLGHVALLTRFLVELGKSKPKLGRTVVVLFIAGEEGGEIGVGVDEVVKDGKLEEAKNGPVYWVDSADSQPCCGTAGMMTWSLKCTGRLFHSGIPQKGINSIEFASEALSYIQSRFYNDFPPHPAEDRYQFGVGSTMKPTQIECAKGSLNQICPETTISGDIRLSPFYEVEDVKSSVERYVDDLNQGDLDHLPLRGTWSRFNLPHDVEVQKGERRRGLVELKWQEEDSFLFYAGVACNLESEGHKAIVQAIRETMHAVKPFSVNGSLPLVKMMQRGGFDIQLCGFGLMALYHGVNEHCKLTDMKKAYEVFLRVVSLLETTC